MTDQIAVESNGISITADGEIIVSKVRPMRDRPRSGRLVMVFVEPCTSSVPFFGFVLDDTVVCHEFKKKISLSKCYGWLPMPIYRPE